MGRRPMPHTPDHSSNRAAAASPQRGRRSLLQALGGLVALTGVAGQAQGATQDDTIQIEVRQGGSSRVVEPMSGSGSAADFYNKTNGGSNTPPGLEQHGASLLFFWRDPDGALSLVVIHDHPESETGGSVRLAFDGLPVDNGRWVVMDDTQPDGDDFKSPTDTTIEWNWTDGYNDGGVFKGLTNNFELTIDPTFNIGRDDATLTEWHLLTGSPTRVERIGLALDQPVTITPVTQDAPPTTESDLETESDSEDNTDAPDYEHITVRSLIPTQVTDDGTPVETESDSNWVVSLLGEEWSAADGGAPPEWVTEYADDPDDSGKYARIPAFLTVSASFGDADTVLFEDLDVVGEDTPLYGAGVRSDALPAENVTPGVYEFDIVTELEDPDNTPFENTIDGLPVSQTLPHGTPVVAEAMDQSGRLEFRSYRVPYERNGEVSTDGLTDIVARLRQTVDTPPSFTRPDPSDDASFPLQTTVEPPTETVLDGDISYFLDPDSIYNQYGMPVDVREVADLQAMSFADGYAFAWGNPADGSPVGLSGPFVTLAARPETQ